MAKKQGGYAQYLYKQSAIKLEKLGTIMELDDGRVFAYARCGASGISKAQLTQNSVVDTNAHNEQVAVAAALGATDITITFGGAVTLDYYADGYMHVNDVTGEGDIYRVQSHAAGTSAVAVKLRDPIRTAIPAATSDVTFTKHPQDYVIVCPTTLTGTPVGVPLINVTAYYYFWNQVKGPCPVLTDGTIAIGEWVAPSNGTAGAVEALVAATTPDVSVGTVLQVNATTDYSLIMLAIPGY